MRETVAVLLAFGMMLLLMPQLIPLLRKMKMGQTIYELGPEQHKKKQGIPNMGGLAIALATVVSSTATALWQGTTQYLLPLLLMSLGTLTVGFLDDYTKDMRKTHDGLTPRQKIIGQVIVGIAFSLYCAKAVGTSIRLPFTAATWDLGVFYVPIMVLYVIFMTNSANLQDGVDGLLSTVTMVGGAALGIAAMMLTPVIGDSAVRDVMFALVGACAGFFVFNRHPAKIFMGDTGSMFIGGAMVGASMLMGLQLFMVLIGFTMIMSSVSVIMQRIYFKLTHGKRIFRMSPIHHHFELGGMNENQIVVMYGLVTFALSVLALIALLAARHG